MGKEGQVETFDSWPGFEMLEVATAGTTNGSDDLARAVEFILKRYRGELGWRGGLKLADRRYFGGGLTTMKRRLGGTTSVLVS